jgi:SAM-dependent methyltransferase
VHVTKLYTDDADLYDIAFDWDVSAEVEWLVDRLGPGCRSIFEPGCGSGRMLDAFASHGLEVVGIDSSPPMVALARERLAGVGSVHGRSRQRSRIKVLRGPRAGETVEEVHDMTAWTPGARRSRSPGTSSRTGHRRREAPFEPTIHRVRMMLSVARCAMMVRMRPTRNWAWALGGLVVWAAMFFAFLLIAIPRH